MSLRNLYYRLPANWRLMARKIYYLPQDLKNSWSGKRHKYEPPKGDIYIGSGDFIKQGKHHLDLLIKYLGLQPQDHVLDIGSGIGRTAAALTGYLDQSESRYEGFDVVKKGIEWCNNTIRKDYPNFNFTYTPLSNDLYNRSSIRSEDFVFPYDVESFDREFLFSVFTHMQPAEIDHYLSEISRTLKPTGNCLATFFLYKKEEKEYIIKQNSFKFSVDEGDYLLMHATVKSANVALQIDLLKKMVVKNGLQILNRIDGYWKDEVSENPENDFQDIIVLSKDAKL